MAGNSNKKFVLKFEKEFHPIDLNLVNVKNIVLQDFPIEDGLWVVINGIEYTEGASRDYVLTGKTIEFNNGVLTSDFIGDEVKIRYVLKGD